MASAKKSNQEASAERGAKKVAAFKSLAVKRTNMALDRIERILPLANTRSYTYDAAQAKKITDALKAAVEKIEKAFASPTAAKSSDFSL